MKTDGSERSYVLEPTLDVCVKKDDVTGALLKES